MAQPRKYQPKEFEKKVEKYFKDRPYPAITTVSGLCLHLGITYSGFRTYKERADTADICRLARQRIENRISELALANKISVPMSIFTLKNNFGWSDSGMRVSDENTEKQALNIKIEIEDGRSGKENSKSE